MVQNIHLVQIMTMQMQTSRIGHLKTRRMFCAIPSERGLTMAILRKSDKPRRTLTRLEKGKRWAIFGLLLTLGYSTYANVRSGQMMAEPIVTSVLPTAVLFFTIHLMSYFVPKNKLQMGLVWVGLGIVALVSFGVSGFHIWELTVRNGQHWIVALFYPIITDVPSAIATAILVQKVSTNQNGQTVEKPAKAATPATPAKTTPKRTSATKSSPATKAAPRTRKTNATIAQESPIFRAAVIDDNADKAEIAA